MSFCPSGQSLLHGRIHELCHQAAGVADGECHGMLGVIAMVVADDECIETFEPVHQAEVDEFVQRTVHLQRRSDALSLKTLKDRIG